MLGQYLSIARYQFTFRATTQLRLPDFAGSALRGSFGHALRQLSCITGERTCENCPVAGSCPYAQVFEPVRIARQAESFTTIQKIPVPYIIEPPAWGEKFYEEGDELEFGMVLMGGAFDHLALIIMAWRRAFLRGVGTTKGKAELTKVEWHRADSIRENIYSESAPFVAAHNPVLEIPVATAAVNMHLFLESPLRIVQSGNVLGARELGAGILLRSLIRRLSMMAQFHLPSTIQADMEIIMRLNALANDVQDEKRLRWRDGQRFSSRQQQKTPLGGVVGRWYLLDVPVDLQPFLHVGQWLHVGKETAFGLGRYRIIDHDWKTEVKGEIA